MTSSGSGGAAGAALGRARGPQGQADLARQLDPLRVDRDQQALVDQPVRRREVGRAGGRAGVAHRPHRRAGGEAVEDLALGGVGLRDQLGHAGRVGQHLGHGRAGLRLRRRRELQPAQHRHQLEVGHQAHQLPGRPAEAAGVRADRVAHRRGEVQQVLVAPDERAVEQRVEAVVGRPPGVGLDRVGGVRGQDEGFEAVQGGGIERVDGALGRGAHPDAPGQRGEVGRRGEREIRAQAEQRCQLPVVAPAQPLGQRGGAGRRVIAARGRDRRCRHGWGAQRPSARVGRFSGAGWT